MDAAHRSWDGMPLRVQDPAATSFYACYLQAQNRLHAAQSAWTLAALLMVAGIVWLLVAKKNRDSLAKEASRIRRDPNANTPRSPVAQ